MNNSSYETKVTICGKEYPMCYTISAYIECTRIAEDRGNISALPESQKVEVTLLFARAFINGAIALHNLQNRTSDPSVGDEDLAAFMLMTPEEYVRVDQAVADMLLSVKNRDIKLEDSEAEKKETAAE